ncbi:MAG: VanZ family protein [Woeseiaceae bacterium]
MMLLVLIAALMPAVWFFDDKVRILSWLDNSDKWMHAATFLVLSLWYAGQYRPRSYWRIAVGLMAFGLFIEFCQRMVGYRMADWADVGANTIGIVIGLVIAMAGAGGWCLRVETWLAARQTSM